jgi:hypothetical protein
LVRRVAEISQFRPSPRDAQIDLVVIHSISLPPGQYGTGAVQQLFTNQLDWDAHPYYQGIRGLEVSSHFFITRQGEIWQFVSCDDRAWHAGVSQWRGRERCNDDSIGIELEGLEGLSKLRSTRPCSSFAWPSRRTIRCATLPGTSTSHPDASRTPARALTGSGCSSSWAAQTHAAGIPSQCCSLRRGLKSS